MSQITDINHMGLRDPVLERALPRSQNLPGMACFYRPTGSGKCELNSGETPQRRL